MMLDADVYDVAPSTSAVSILHEHGADPWVVDFGAPEREEGGLERSLNDHVLAIDEAIDRVREETGRDRIHIGGYSQGGMFCYQVAAYRRSEGIDSVVAFGSPVDTRGDAVLRHPRGGRDRAPRRSSPSTSSRPAASRPGSAAPGSGCSTRRSRCGNASSSSASCTTARRCSRANASDASSRPRAGSPGRARRSPT